MKKIILTFTLVWAMFLGASAQSVVALHSASGVTMFQGSSGFVDAYGAAVDGDTIYLPGGAFASPSIIDKSLRIYGAGFHYDSTQVTLLTSIIGDIEIRENSSGTHIEGVRFKEGFESTSNTAISNFSFSRCFFDEGIRVYGSAHNVTNFSFIQCVFTLDVHIPNMTNSSFHNSIFTSYVSFSDGNVFSNSIFMYDYSGTSPTSNELFRSCDFNIVKNNIFLMTSRDPDYIFYASDSDGNMLYNNLFVSNNIDDGANQVTSGNYFGVPQADIFVNQTGNSFSFSHDYHLQAPATYLGNDGTQVGLYGGIFPLKEGFVPENPHFQMKNIANQTNSNGELEVEIKIEAQ
ncbi:MAG: hypothetical protein H6599_08700 [Flavobacteriales bacterium]|nr:hypothetical protein [Flavobacteriales bacterium]